MKKIVGEKGENIAKTYLIKKGFSFIATNWRQSHREIDLIFYDKKARKLVFIEVKTRKLLKDERSFSVPLQEKQNKNIKKAALAYCLINKFNPEKTRFDLILILYKDKKCTLRHYCDINR